MQVLSKAAARVCLQFAAIATKGEYTSDFLGVAMKFLGNLLLELGIDHQLLCH